MEMLTGFIARDADGDLSLSLLPPHRNEHQLLNGETVSTMWISALCKQISLPNEFYPEITWETEPKKCELLINLIDNNESEICMATTSDENTSEEVQMEETGRQNDGENV